MGAAFRVRRSILQNADTGTGRKMVYWINAGFLGFVSYSPRRPPGVTVKSPATGAGPLVSDLLLPIPVAVTLIGVSAIVSRPNTLRILVTVIVG